MDTQSGHQESPGCNHRLEFDFRGRCTSCDVCHAGKLRYLREAVPATIRIQG